MSNPDHEPDLWPLKFLLGMMIVICAGGAIMAVFTEVWS